MVAEAWLLVGGRGEPEPCPDRAPAYSPYYPRQALRCLLLNDPVEPGWALARVRIGVFDVAVLICDAGAHSHPIHQVGGRLDHIRPFSGPEELQLHLPAGRVNATYLEMHTCCQASR